MPSTVHVFMIYIVIASKLETSETVNAHVINWIWKMKNENKINIR